jgi:hypothetical protein
VAIDKIDSFSPMQPEKLKLIAIFIIQKEIKMGKRVITKEDADRAGRATD